MVWQPIEQLVNEAIWVLKYDLYSTPDGNFCKPDHPQAQKFTSCHGWYTTEVEALKVRQHFQNPNAYRIERVYRRQLLPEPIK